MSSAPAPPAPDGQPARSFGGGRVLLLVVGSIGILLALALLAGGGVAVWALGQRDDDGYFTSETHRLSTSSYALATQSLDVNSDAPSWVFGHRFATVRIQAGSTRPVFIGIGRARDIERYLANVRHDQITDVNTDPFSVSTRHLSGPAQPRAPASQRIWRVQASGPGRQTITWPVEAGDWSAVAMNADGSSGVSVDARFGARVPALRWVTIGLLVVGGLLLLLGAALFYLGARTPRPRPGAPELTAETST
jgi:hypothetical protein